MMTDTSNIIFIIFIMTHVCFGIKDEYLDWAVEIEGGEEIAKKTSDDSGFIYLGPVGNLENIYHFQKKVPRRQKRSVDLHTDKLRSHEKVSWVEAQKSSIRVKRDYQKENYKREVLKMFNDPRWPEEWYLFNSQSLDSDTKYDMQVLPVWLMNITGRNVKLTIIDDGIEHTHPDLKKNYCPLCSTDVNDNDDDPMPHTGPGTSNEHGTRCASEISMVADNNICGIGIAYNSKIGGIRLLDGRISDLIEAKSLGFRNNYIDIYSASWGPMDDGMTVDGPGLLASRALKRGAEHGRKGKGNLYVWASGNGGDFGDSCNCDGYTSSIYVITVSSISSSNKIPVYTEPCSVTMCSTYSSSSLDSKKLIVADLGKSCATNHSGTSASAPFAAGIFALVLEVNPDLTWRDIKHLITWTSDYKSLSPIRDWKKNFAGFWVSRYSGFGLLNALQMVRHAKSWKKVPELMNCTINMNSQGKISKSKPFKETISGNRCSKDIAFIENIVITISLSYPTRGALEITLRSPHGMNTTLLPKRFLDNNSHGLKKWNLTTVHNWGENPGGNWKVFIEDKREDNEERKGNLEELAITFYGTAEKPYHIRYARNNQREY